MVGPSMVPPHINDAVLAAQDPVIGDAVVTAYIDAFRLGFRILAGIAGFQFILCLGLGKVVLDGASVSHADSKALDEGSEAKEESSKVN